MEDGGARNGSNKVLGKTEWVPTMHNHIVLRVANSHITVTIIDPRETVDKGMEGVTQVPTKTVESMRLVVMNVDKKNAATQH
ncbi:hypothetical protein V6N13_072016 [Hibiscus sabdariffa]